MNGLDSLQALGLSLPSPAYIVGALLFGLLGLAAWRHGKRSGRPRTRWLGLALMVYPYLVPGTPALWGVGLLLCAGIWWDQR